MPPDPPGNDARRALAAQQARLVAALQGKAEAPADFNADHLSTAAAALVVKRRRALEKLFPSLPTFLAERFDSEFAQYVLQFPGPPEEGAAEDALRFAEWLASTHELPDDVRLAVAAARSQRGFPVRVLLMKRRRSVAVILRIPVRGVRVIWVPLWPARQ